MKAKKYKFSSKVWLYQGGTASWHFITLPEDISAEIKHNWKVKKAAWGSVRVWVSIGDTSWQTSIFYDSKKGCYILPLKADVRKKEKIKAGDLVKPEITL